MIRRIDGLKWAKPCKRPLFARQGRARGAKAAGLRYERQLAQALGSWIHGQWFEFEDRRGHGFCQVDFMRACQGGALIIESKYTWTEEGHRQVEFLYRPVVEAAFGSRAFGGLCCKVLVSNMPRAIFARSLVVVQALGEFESLAKAGCSPVLHWIGNVTLGAGATGSHSAPLAPGHLGL